MIEFWFHSFDIDSERKNPDGGRLYLHQNYVKRDEIDEEGHWRIISPSLKKLLSIVDEQINAFVGYTYAIPLVTFTDMPEYGDLGWEIYLDVGSWSEM